MTKETKEMLMNVFSTCPFVLKRVADSVKPGIPILRKSILTSPFEMVRA